MRVVVGLVIASIGCGSAATTEPQAASPPREAPVTAAAPATVEKPAGPEAALIGTTPPEWRAERWMNTKPLRLASLRGSVVLVRWWTSGCPFCSATAPALRTFDKTYGPRGLKVIGMYHHKEDTPFDPKVYEDTARTYEFTFPVAFDPEWQDLHAWMRDANGKPVDTGWTSVTFLLDKHGVVRHVHPGGQYVDGDASYGGMQAAIEQLLAEK